MWVCFSIPGSATYGIYQAFDKQTGFSWVFNFAILSYSRNSRKFDARKKYVFYSISLKRSAQVQYNYNTTAIQELFSCIAVTLCLCGSLYLHIWSFSVFKFLVMAQLTVNFWCVMQNVYFSIICSLPWIDDILNFSVGFVDDKNECYQNYSGAVLCMLKLCTIIWIHMGSTYKLCIWLVEV